MYSYAHMIGRIVFCLLAVSVSTTPGYGSGSDTHQSYSPDLAQDAVRLPGAIMVRDEIEIEQVIIQGLRRTQEDTILGLLPRAVPGRLTRTELQEFERRIRNLSLFDRVGVAVGDRMLTVEVLEKFTLVPNPQLFDREQSARSQRHRRPGGIQHQRDGNPTWRSIEL